MAARLWRFKSSPRHMCPTCVLTIGTGLLIARRFGINDILSIGIITVIISFLIDFMTRRVNKGKVFFPYQRIVVTAVVLLITIFVAKFLL